MTKREVFQLLKKISQYYDSFEINQEKVDHWYEVLKDYSYAKLEKNLRKHVEYSIYPPKIAGAIKKLMGLQVKTATNIRNGEEMTIPLEDVMTGDTLLVRPGEKVPVDGETI